MSAQSPGDKQILDALALIAALAFKNVVDVLDFLPQKDRRDVLRALAVRYRDDLAAISKPA